MLSIEMRHHPEKLRYNWEFQNGYQNGRKCWNRFFVIYVLPNRFNSVRLGITVSKRTGGSVQRNRIKRLVRESFRFIKCKLKRGYDIIVIGRKPAIQLKCQQAQSELTYLFRRARLFIK
ncbi:TPA: ribonuclease P protein component [Candidatus Poribacteria bacterium]|nr:ribonuclease P protein component [Candidatus Poribacteria bacterium]HIB88616.1 ribonuclease P protein component [Candidatus Poribacteria bacterium]HIC01232.1 ribonuclease P protein component [Candidatus Poribacteria bacterium]HIM09365.1 ribonuclease P protein component [Candidatus Poribacteria bacterium]HIN29160.1 ribonuclease P protein component [Candidatus Poribacteria bacterium]